MKLSPRARNTLIMVGVGAVVIAALAYRPLIDSTRNSKTASVTITSGADAGSVRPIIDDAKSLQGRTQGAAPEASTGMPLPGAAVLQVGFSPGPGGLRVVLNMINGAEREIRLAAYSFTSPEVVKALIAAKRRGVDVKVVVDKKGNASNSASRQALNLLVNNGISVRLNGKYQIHHDKFVVADRSHLQTGSFNYSRSAETRNSENVLAIWNVPELAKQYLNHWESRYSDGVLWQSAY